jgi:hypothetical protein
MIHNDPGHEPPIEQIRSSDKATSEPVRGPTPLAEQVTKTVLQYVACRGLTNDGTPITNLRIAPQTVEELHYDPYWMPFTFQDALRSRSGERPMIEPVRRLTFTIGYIDFIAVLHASLRQAPNMEVIHFENFTDSLDTIMAVGANGRRLYPDISIQGDQLFLRGIPLTFRTKEEGAINYLRG